MFKCRSCAYISSHVDGKDPCPMCNYELLLGHRGSVLDVVEATWLALDPNLVGSEVKVVGTTGCGNLESILDKVEACRLALDPSLVKFEVKFVGTMGRGKNESIFHLVEASRLVLDPKLVG